MNDLVEKLATLFVLLLCGAGTIAFVSVMIAIIKAIWTIYIL